MVRSFSLFILGIAALAMFATGCSSSDSGSGAAAATTYTVSGTMDPGQTSNSFAWAPQPKLSEMTNEELMELMALRPFARTQCTNDGQFYDVYCVSFSSTPVAASGDVDCANGGAFSVEGMPLNEPIGCFVRRYSDATSSTGTTIGAVEIPAANLNGSSDSLVASGDVTLAITVGNDGKITATVTGEVSTPSENTAFTSALNGVYTLACSGNTGEFDVRCKCFFDENTYPNEDACMSDNASQISSASLDIGMYIYGATVNAGGLPIDNNQTLPEGASVKAISIWAAPGGTSSKTGGEGVTNLGNALTWETTPLDPQAAVAWTSNTNVTVKDGNNNDVTFTFPDLSAINGGADFNDYTHAQWVVYARAVAAAAGAAAGQNFECTWGPGSAYAHHSQGNTPGAAIQNNAECVNQVMAALDDDSVTGTFPDVFFNVFCDQNGCDISTDANDSGDTSIYDANAFNRVRFHIGGRDLNYPQSQDTAATDHSAVGPVAQGGIGVDPSSRHVFEPLISYPNGAGFRQKDEYTSHFPCVDSNPGSFEVENAACTGGGHFELRCVQVEELSIKFLGTASPFNVVFDSAETMVAAQLVNHNGGPNPVAVNPTGTTVIDLCNTKLNSGGGVFTATATAN